MAIQRDVCVCVCVCVYPFLKVCRKGTIIEKYFPHFYFGHLSISAHKSLPYSFNTCIVFNQDVLCNWAACVLHTYIQVRGWNSAQGPLVNTLCLSAPSHKDPLLTLLCLWQPTPDHPSGWPPPHPAPTLTSHRGCPSVELPSLPCVGSDGPHSQPSYTDAFLTPPALVLW